MRPLALVILLLGAAPAAAQEVPGRVEYVAGGTLYIGVTAAARWLPGDTVRVARLRTGDWAGSLRVLGASEARLAGEWLTGAIPFAAGDSVRLELPRARLDSVALPAPVPAERAADLPAGAAARPLRRARFSGRLGIELDAARTDAPGTRSALEGTSLLPALRLRGALGGLPAGLRLRANLRGSYRYSEGDLYAPAAQLFASELALERTGERVQLRAGRFANPYEPYSGYWDGALVRVGREDAVGAGAAYGFDPRYGNQAFQADRPKLTAFVDVHRHGRSLRYDGDISLHRHWESDSAAATALGWTQQLAVGGVRMTQLLRADDGPDGWRLGLAQLSASAPLAAGARLRLRFTHDDPRAFYGLPADAAWRSRRAGAGLSWFGARANAGVDVNAAWRQRDGEEDRRANAIGGWLDVPRVPFAGVGFDVSASRWSEGDQRTLLLAPGIRQGGALGLVRAGYERYRHEWAGDATTQHAVSGSWARQFGRGALDAQLRHEWGGLTATRVLMSYWVAL